MIFCPWPVHKLTVWSENIGVIAPIRTLTLTPNKNIHHKTLNQHAKDMKRPFMQVLVWSTTTSTPATNTKSREHTFRHTDTHHCYDMHEAAGGGNGFLCARFPLLLLLLLMIMVRRKTRGKTSLSPPRFICISEHTRYLERQGRFHTNWSERKGTMPGLWCAVRGLFSFFFILYPPSGVWGVRGKEHEDKVLWGVEISV